MPRRRLPALLAVTLGLALAWGLYQLLALRLERGDVYPPYSTLRADPSGAKALYEAFSLLGGLNTARSYIPPWRVEGSGTLVLAGFAGDVLAEEREPWTGSLDRFARSGGRVVLTVDPTEPWWAGVEDADAQTPEKEEPAKTPVRKKAPQALGRLWGFGLTYVTGAKEREAARTPEAEATLPSRVAWLSGWRLEHLSAEWRVLYRIAGAPVIAERTLGRGSVLLCSDSYFLSNEGLRDDRASGLLAHLPGPPPLLFDETHLGVQEDPGVMTLARRYRLHGFLAALLLLAAGYLWMVLAPFVPPPEEEGSGVDGRAVAGRGAASGLVTLLRRSVPSGSLVPACYAAWKSSLERPESARLRERIARMDAALSRERSVPQRRRNAAAAYNALRKILTERKPP